MKKLNLLAPAVLALCTPLWADTKPIEPSMVRIGAGQFLMGSDQDIKFYDQIVKDHQPSHLVTLKAFNLGKYEVTVKEFAQFIAATHYPASEKCIQMHDKNWFDEVPGSWQKNSTLGNEFEPVTCIGWKAAQAYVQWLAKETGRHYRLASEAEWEYAARAGSSSRFYWGEDGNQACRYANIADQAAEARIKRDYDGLESKDHVGVVPCDDQSGYASIVGMYLPNAFGLYDMIGNANEFVQDCYVDGYIGAPVDGSARENGECEERVLRGGAWHWAAFTASQRIYMPEDFIGAIEGFRIAETLDETNPASAHSSTSTFELELHKAQARLLKTLKPRQ